MDRKQRQWMAAVLVALMLLIPAPGRLCAQASGPSDVESGEISKSTDLEDNSINRPPTDESYSWIQTILALVVVASLIFAVGWLLRRFGGPRGRSVSAGPIRILVRVNLSSKHQLFLVRLGRRIVMVGAGPQGLSALGEVCEQQELNELMEAVESTHGGALAGIFRRVADRSSDTVEQVEQPIAVTDSDDQPAVVKNLSKKLRSRLTGKEEER